ncbi:MAG: tetratricopeptide repeat protein [Verrucomicrobiota bacterium]
MKASSKIVCFILSLLIFIGLSVGGYLIYPTLKEWRLLATVDRLEEAKSYDQALFFLNQILSNNPDSMAANQKMGELLLRLDAPIAMLWIGKWAELDTNNPKPRLTLGKYLLVQGDLDQARICLEAARKLPDVSEFELADLEMGILIKEEKRAEAIQILNQHVTKPNCPNGLKLNLAKLLLSQPSEGERHRGEELLEQFEGQANLFEDALLLRIQYLVNQNRLSEARKHGLLLQRKSPDSLDAASWLFLIQLLSEKSDLDQNDLLVSLLNEDPETIRGFVQFLLTQGKLADAEDWLTRYFSQAPDSVPKFKAQIIMWEALGRWETIYDQVLRQKWDQSEFVRLLYLIEATRRFSDADANVHLVRELISFARRSPQLVFLFDYNAKRWGWNEHRITLWKESARSVLLPINQLIPALKEADGQKDLIRLFGLTGHVLALRPNDPLVINNYSMYAMLLNLNVNEQLKRAEQNYKKHPEALALRTTYALACFKNGELEKARDLMEEIPQEQRMQPEVAAYYLIVMSEQKELTSDLAGYATLAKQANLLPQEQELLKAGMTRLEAANAF